MLSNSTAERIVETEEQREVRRKAESIQAAKDAAAEREWLAFEALHTGVRGLYSSGVSTGDASNLLEINIANRGILTRYCEKHYDEGATAANLERAFAALKDTDALCSIRHDPTENVSRRVSQNGNARNLFPDQQLNRPRALTQLAVLPFTKRDLLKMSNEDYPRFRRLYDKFGSKAINAILQGEE